MTKTFLITGSAYIRAESREDAIRQIEEEKRGDTDGTPIMDDMLGNYDINEEKE